MLFLTNESPSIGYKIGMVVVLICAIALITFLVATDAVSVFKAALLSLGVGSLIFFYTIPILAKRPNYIGSEPSRQLARVRMLPYLGFVTICVLVAVYDLYSAT